MKTIRMLTIMFLASFVVLLTLVGSVATGEIVFLDDFEDGSATDGAPVTWSPVPGNNWHRIGLVWDGLRRTLYVDDILVAEDTQQGLESSIDGLNIGTGKDIEPGTYFSGMIDDVRIYDVALSAEEIAALAQ
jgi:hypothetical protein